MGKDRLNGLASLNIVHYDINVDTGHKSSTESILFCPSSSKFIKKNDLCLIVLLKNTFNIATYKINNKYKYGIILFDNY